MTRAKELLIVVGNPEILNVSNLFSFSVSSNFSLTWKKKTIFSSILGGKLSLDFVLGIDVIKDQ